MHRCDDGANFLVNGKSLTFAQALARIQEAGLYEVVAQLIGEHSLTTKCGPRPGPGCISRSGPGSWSGARGASYPQRTTGYTELELCRFNENEEYSRKWRAQEEEIFRKRYSFRGRVRRRLQGLGPLPPKEETMRKYLPWLLEQDDRQSED